MSSCAPLPKAAKPVRTKQLTRLSCLVVYVKFQFVYAHKRPGFLPSSIYATTQGSEKSCKICCFAYPNWNLTYTTRQGSRVSCLVLTGFAAFGKGAQLLISGFPYAETKQLSQSTSLSGVLATTPKLDLGRRGEEIASQNPVEFGGIGTGGSQ